MPHSALQRFKFKAMLLKPEMKIQFDGGVSAVDADSAVKIIQHMAAGQFETEPDNIKVLKVEQVKQKGTKNA